jgi:hypothetical protein
MSGTADQTTGSTLGRPRHTCHATGCPTTVPPRMFMCRVHWYRLTRDHRAAIWATYRPGQEVTKDPSPEYLEAAQAAIRYLERVEDRA